MNPFLETILVLAYTLLFIYSINKHSFFIKSGIEPLWLTGLFLLKIGVGVLLYLIYTKFYAVRSDADIFKYFDDSQVIYNSLWSNPLEYFRLVFTSPPENQYYHDNYYNVMDYWANKHNSFFYGDSKLMIKVNAFFRLFSFGSFHVHSVFFNFLSFIGLVSMYRASKKLFSSHYYYLILVVFCLPSVLFWSSSVLKESLLVLFLGILVFNLQKLSSLKYKEMFFVVLALLFLSLLKFYIVIALLFPLIAYVLTCYFRKTKPFIIYSIVLILFIVFVFGSGFFMPTSLVDILVLKQSDFLNLNTNAGSFYKIPLLEPSFSSVLKSVPLGILNSFIRPLPSSSISIMAIPAIFENILILLALFASFLSMFSTSSWKSRSNNNWLMFQICFTLVLFALIGMTTPVAGALVRYKVAALPFLGVMLYYFIYKRFLEKD